MCEDKTRLYGNIYADSRPEVVKQKSKVEQLIEQLDNLTAAVDQLNGAVVRLNGKL